MTIPVLETERLILRAPSIEDHARECLFYADAEHARFVGGAKSAFDCWGIIAGRLGHWQIKGYGFWHLDERASGRYVGRVGLIEPYGWPEREIGWSLMPDALGHGYATEAALAVRDYAYGVLGWTTAISLIDPGNAASEAVATRIGAQF
ncbi:MAG: GNAT family N-acetyltransferase, partial [Pseudomonadota bacterium]